MNGNGGMDQVWKVVHAKSVIRLLLLALISALLYVGNGYAERLKEIEAWKKDQNEHLSNMAGEMRGVKDMLTEIRTEQREMRTEQRRIHVDVELVKQKVGQR